MEEFRKSSLLLFEQFWQLLCYLSLTGMCRKKTKRQFFLPKDRKTMLRDFSKGES